MPRLNQPLSLRKCTLRSLARHFEVVCYGPRRRLGDLIEDGTYLTVPGPFVQWRKSFIVFSWSFMWGRYCCCPPILDVRRHDTQLERRLVVVLRKTQTTMHGVGGALASTTTKDP